MTNLGSFIVQGLPPDDWEGNDMRGRSWGMGSRVRVEVVPGPHFWFGCLPGSVRTRPAEYATGIVCGAVSVQFGWNVGVRFDDGSVASFHELQIDLWNPPHEWALRETDA
jgi:hypothetical protein